MYRLRSIFLEILCWLAHIKGSCGWSLSTRRQRSPPSPPCDLGLCPQWPLPPSCPMWSAVSTSFLVWHLVAPSSCLCWRRCSPLDLLLFSSCSSPRTITGVHYAWPRRLVGGAVAVLFPHSGCVPALTPQGSYEATSSLWWQFSAW